MKVHILIDEATTPEKMADLFGFLRQRKLTPEGTQVYVTGGNMDVSDYLTEGFELVEKTNRIDLEVAFLNDERSHNAALVKNAHVPKLLVGPDGLPGPDSLTVIPFEGRKMRPLWLRHVLDHAQRHQWQVVLLHCDHSLVPNEIVKFGDWFRLDWVRETLEEWLTEDMREKVSDLIEAYPGITVYNAIGNLSKALMERTQGSGFILGSLMAGYHLPHRHHGLNYAKLLTKTRSSGYFLAEG